MKQQRKHRSSIPYRKANVKGFLGLSPSFRSLEMEDSEDRSSSPSDSTTPSLDLSQDSSIPNDDSLPDIPESTSLVSLDVNLDDLDNYMLSVFQLEGSSVASHSSLSSTVSTRRRKGGAASRRKASGKAPAASVRYTSAPSWVETMEAQSLQAGLSMNWTPEGGWKKWNDDEDVVARWDAAPTDDWQESLPGFDAETPTGKNNEDLLSIPFETHHESIEKAV